MTLFHLFHTPPQKADAEKNHKSIIPYPVIYFLYLFPEIIRWYLHAEKTACTKAQSIDCDNGPVVQITELQGPGERIVCNS